MTDKEYNEEVKEINNLLQKAKKLDNVLYNYEKRRHTNNFYKKLTALEELLKKDIKELKEKNLNEAEFKKGLEGILMFDNYFSGLSPFASINVAEIELDYLIKYLSVIRECYLRYQNCVHRYFNIPRRKSNCTAQDNENFEKFIKELRESEYKD